MARSIDGRSEDLIYLENRQGRLVPVHPILFAQSLEALPEVREDQVVQEPGRLLVRLALRPGSVAERVEEKVRARFKEGLGGQEIECPRLDYEFVDRFERDRSANAKFKLVVSNLRRAQPASVDAEPSNRIVRCG